MAISLPPPVISAPVPAAFDVAREVQHLELVERLRASPFLSYQREADDAERLHRFYADAKPGEAERLLDETAEDAITSNEVWKGNAEPMPFDEFCYRLDESHLTPHQLKAFADTDLLRARNLFAKGRKVQEFTLVWGKGSGKGYVGCKFIAWVTYVALHLKGDPAVFFGLAAGTKLGVLNVAPTEHQARTVVFDQLRRFVGHSLFARFMYSAKKQILTDSISFLRPNKNGLAYPYLSLFSRHSRSTGIEGHNLLAWVMDEADEFMDKAEKSNAEAVHSILRSSCNTRVGDSWIGMVISYPRTEDGFMMRQYRENQDEETFYCDLAPTWVVRPSFSRDQRAVVYEYKQNPRLAAAKYECRPMASAGAFFEHAEKITECVDVARRPVAEYKPTVIFRDALVNGETKRIPFIGAKRTSAITPTPGHRYYIGVDAGEKRDAFLISVWHIDASADAAAYLCPRCARNPDLRNLAPYQDIPDEARAVREHLDPDTREQPRCGTCHLTPGAFGAFATMFGWLKRDPAPLGVLMSGDKEYSIPKVYEDLILEVRPEPAGVDGHGSVGKTVCFVTMENLLSELILGLGGATVVRKVRCDPWQTVQLRQGVMSTTGADVDEISFANSEQYKRATLNKALLYNLLLAFLPHDGRDTEWRRLEDLNGRKVDHPEGGSKDIYDAEAIAIWEAVTDRCEELGLSWM